jgi:hypothetical protein
MNTTKTDGTAPEGPGTPDGPEDRTVPAAADSAADRDLLVTLDSDDDEPAHVELGEELTDAELTDDFGTRRPPGVAAAAAALTGAGLGLVSLSGSWVSRILTERQTLIGQIESADAASTREKIAALYGDPWHTTALVNGCFAALALLIGLFVLARPAFGPADRTPPLWVRAASWTAVVLGLLGLLISGVMYTDVLTPLPSAP